ncbi:TetR/AcrR family transcriptional regulator [Deinococcus hopiensis]|uniref:Transcriptional regulator, TetR family n=1 Tax=Deinococcus hopiensis KR-140 TaxID=695939 RepID=A0A1W1V6B3_9DEIO|nr:TetR/AcrR family transcriptional regulator [Deinococcus hopiensis]SMB88853.1 transcriptional regulator, TetR family [Deinococcus hopiensis KR-140]
MTRKSRTDWLRAGVEVLTAQGDEGLNVETLLGHLGVSKGSFYHHFTGLADYKAQLLAHLEKVGFADVVAGVDPAQPAARQLQQLTQEIAGRNLAQDWAVRRWAERDAGARALVERMDARRLAYLETLFSESTGDAAQGQFFARMAYAFFLGAPQLRPAIAGEEYVRMVQTLNRLLPPPPAGPEASCP